MDFKRELKERTENIEKILAVFAPEEQGFQKTIFQAMNYSLMAGGKRLRPLLIQETYRLFGGSHEAVIHPFMAAIEMIHTYSLIHDDLPALDNDEYRRGRKTSHVVFGEAMAILAGDALLNYAYEIAAGAFDLAENDVEFRRVARALQVLTAKPGIYGMIGGQVVDVEMTGKELSKEQLEYVYENKTGALIEASMMIGAILAGADEAKVAAVHKIASDVGMAFQIQDDILDVCGDSALLGKPTLSDEENGKVTYVTIHGIDESRRYVTELSERAVRELEEIGGDNEFLKELVIWLINRDK